MSTWLADCGPVGWALITGMCIVLFGLRSRLDRWFLIFGLALLAVGAHVACFDGRPHVNQKFDATVLVWARTVWLRAVSGLVAIVLAAPLGQVAGRLAGVRRGWLGGLLVLGCFGFGLLASSVILQRTLYLSVMRASAGSSQDGLAALRAGVGISTWVLIGSAVVTLLGTVSLAAWWLRAESESSKGLTR